METSRSEHRLDVRLGSLGVEMLLRDQDEGYLYIFIDENQVLYPRQGKLPVEDEPFYLRNL